METVRDGGAENEGSWASSRYMMVASCAGDGKTRGQAESLSCSVLQPRPQQQLGVPENAGAILCCCLWWWGWNPGSCVCQSSPLQLSHSTLEMGTWKFIGLMEKQGLSWDEGLILPLGPRLGKGCL